MKISLSDNYFIEQIPLCYVLRKAQVTYGCGRNKSDKPRMTVKDLGYYMSVKDAIEGYVKKLAYEKTEDFNGNLEDYCDRLQNIFDGATNAIVKLL